MDLNRLKNRQFDIEDQADQDQLSMERGIAVIGMSAQIGDADNIEQFWEYLNQGCDLIRDFPSVRFQDADQLNKTWFHTPLPKNPVQAAYLKRVDQFDAQLHNIPPVEAEWMDPVQRLFLESAWSAIEDAGYSTESLSGKKVAVNIGYGSSDNPYHAAMWNAQPETFGVAVSGNVDAMIAGRVSYLLNLKGPAMVINTACSSSLAAVNTACQQLRDGTATMALAGGIKLILIPPDEKYKLGVEASSGRTKTLDENADGTGRGEGVVCMLLKPYLQAKEDKDHIYAVIRGTAANQDGASVGITAPNAGAQEMVIKEAWQDAGVDPLTISFIEMHGTATKLGDTAEITGIERAFRNYTDKSQFCGVGSVKSNIGHLDGAAGLAGMLKAILMLHKKQFAPSIHFNSPNKSVGLISSPVYVNDRAGSWEPECGVRRCGVSSFGISGTNCHVVLEEHVEDNKIRKKEQNTCVITASAKSKTGLKQLLTDYQNFLKKNPQCDLQQFSYTANTGRNQYSWRFAMVVNDAGEFIHQDVDEMIKQAEKNPAPVNALLKEAAGKVGTKEYDSLLKQAAKLYTDGADTNWELLYEDECPGRISIPGYPFFRERHWHEFHMDDIVNQIEEVLHPLVDECSLETEKVHVYTKRMGIDNCWELREHIINGVHVLPGTAVIEMAREALSQYTKQSYVELSQLTYLTPVMLKQGDKPRKINIVLTNENNKITVEIRSQHPDTKEWESHGILKGAAVKRDNQEQIIAVNEIKNRCEPMDEDTGPINRSIVKINGNHWDNVDELYLNKDEILVHFNMKEDIRSELADYYLHPGMLDPALNAGSYLTNGTYLPFSFQTALFEKKLPPCFYSWIKRRQPLEDSGGEFEVFDIIFCDEEGVQIGKVDEYVQKLVRNQNIYTGNRNLNSIFSEVTWVQNDRTKDTEYRPQTSVGWTVVLLRKDQYQTQQYQKLYQYFGEKTVAVFTGEDYQRISEHEYRIKNEIDDFETLLRELGADSIQRVIHLSSYRTEDEKQPLIKQMEEDLVQLKSCFTMVKALYTTGCVQQLDFNILTNYASFVIPEQTVVYPGNSALVGFGKCVRFEYGNITIRTVDFDQTTSFSAVLDEIGSNDQQYFTAYRNGIRYIQQLSELIQIENKEEHQRLLEHGTYVITGGFGGIGLELAKKMFSSSPEINVILLSRSYSDADIDEENSDRKIQKFIEIRDKYPNFHAVKADITKPEDVKHAFDFICSKYGGVNGMIHAAGIAGEGFIINKEWSRFHEVLAPKMLGSAILQQYSEKMDLDFFVTCSSGVSVFGAAGQSDYAAANAYLDGFCEYRKAKGQPALGINWTGWSEAGMAAEHNVSEENSYTLFFDNETGTDAFLKLLSGENNRMLAGRLNYEVLKKEKGILKNIITLPDEILHEGELPMSGVDDCDINNIIVDGIDKDQLDEVEQKVVYAWARSLGAKKVNVTDKFFESGGNSLLAAMLHKELDRIFPEQVSITEIFVYSTILEMAAHIKKKTADQTKQQPKKDIQEQVDIESLVSKFANGELAIDDISGMFSSHD